MSSEADPNDFHQRESANDFEQALQNLAPKAAPLDLSPVEQCVVAPDAAVAQAPQWRLASASWLVGLATGLLVAILGGGAFHAQDVQSEARDSKTQPTAQPQEYVELLPAVAETNPSTAVNPFSWSNQTDYIAAFSPANIDVAHRIDLASRDLLVSFRIDTSEFASSSVTTQSWSDSQSQPPASLGEMRKQLQLAL